MPALVTQLHHVHIVHVPTAAALLQVVQTLMTGQPGAEWSMKFMNSGGVSLLVELVLEVDLCDEPTSTDIDSSNRTGTHAVTVLLMIYNVVVLRNTIFV
jgi:hypothetical protein